MRSESSVQQAQRISLTHLRGGVLRMRSLANLVLILHLFSFLSVALQIIIVSKAAMEKEFDLLYYYFFLTN